MSNDSEKRAESGTRWTEFEMESFESPSLPGKKEKTGFVSLQRGEGEKADFSPLVRGGIITKKEEAEDILREAQEKAELLEREAYENGFAQGEKDGIELGEKKASKLIENLENLFNEISHLKRDIVTHYEREILELIFAIAKKIIHHHITSDEKGVKDTVFEAVRLAAEKSKIFVKVSPEDFECIERLRPEFFIQFKDLKSLTISSDPSITRGGCFLETPYGDVDARVDSQLEKIYQCLEGAFEGKADG